MRKYIWALVETGSTVVFQFLSVVILSRILSPSDYGMIGMMTIFITIGNIFVDAGMGSSLIKKIDADKTDYSTLFWFNLLVSLLLYSILYISAYFLSSFYEIKEFASCLRIYSLFIVISAFGVVQNTQLNKDLRFKEMAIISIISNLVGLAVAIWMANSGYGYWSLIAQQLIYISLRVILQSIINKFIPQRVFSSSSFRYQIGFGGSIMLSNIINVIYSNIISSIIPKVGTLTQNGYYTQASKIQHVPMTIMQSVTDRVLFPVLSKCKSDEEILEKARQSLKLILIVCFFLLFLCAILSKYIVLILLGKNWIDAARYLEILFLAGFATCYQYVVRNIFKSLAKTKLVLLTEIIKAVLGVSMIFMSVSYGIEFMLWGFVVSTIISSGVYIYVLKRSCGYSYRCQMKDMILPVLIQLLTIIISLIY